MSRLTDNEEVIDNMLRAEWSVYGTKHNDWQHVATVVDAQEDAIRQLKFHPLFDGVYLTIKSLSDDLNFLYWLAIAHTDNHDAEQYNPYHYSRKDAA